MRRPRRSGAQRALLVLDMISAFDFEGARPVLRAARRIAPAIARLKSRATAQGTPVIYLNDMGGKWESDQRAYVARCRHAAAPGHDVADCLAPAPGDYFIFKPRHSGFFATPLAELLALLGARELVLTGITSHQCVLFTAMDAYVREFAVVVPSDCIAAPLPIHTRHALFVLQKAVRARTPRSASLRFRR